MNEYEKLLQHYGVSTMEMPYAGLTGDAPEAQAERSAYDDWHDQYKKRLAVTKLYGPGWQGDVLGAPKFTSPLAAATNPLTEATKTPVPVVAPVANPMGVSGGRAMPTSSREIGAGVNDIFNGLQGALNTSTGAAGSWLAGKLGLLGTMTQDGSGIPVSDAVGMTPAQVYNSSTGYTSPTGYGLDGMGPPSSAATGTDSSGAQVGAGPASPMGGDPASRGFGGDSGGDGGAATGGNNGDASGGGDRGTRGGFASGGLAELNAKYAPPGMQGSADIPGNMGLDMSRVSPEQLRMMQQENPMALMRGEDRFIENDITTPQAAAAQPHAGLDLATLLSKYQPSGESQYAGEYAAARKTAAEAQNRFAEIMQQALKQDAESGPSKAEMYFNLAAAFGAPTRTGAFTESLGNAGKVMGEVEKAKREAERANRTQRLSLGMQLAGQQASAAKADVSDLRQLTAEEMRDKRTLSIELLKDYVASGKPQSAAGKQAIDEGLTPGTPAYQTRVGEIGDMLVKRQTAQIDALIAAQGDQGARLALAQAEAEAKKGERSKLTPKELDLKTATEDTVSQTTKVIDTLKEAYKLNPNTFDNSLPDKAQRLAMETAGSKDPKVINTRLLENMLSDQAVAGLKAAFGGNPTEGERAIILSLQGIGAKSVEERAAIIKRAYAAAKTSNARHAQRLADISAGKYRETTPDTKLDTGEL